MKALRLFLMSSSWGCRPEWRVEVCRNQRDYRQCLEAAVDNEDIRMLLIHVGFERFFEDSLEDALHGLDGGLLATASAVYSSGTGLEVHARRARFIETTPVYWVLKVFGADVPARLLSQEASLKNECEEMIGRVPPGVPWLSWYLSEAPSEIQAWFQKVGVRGELDYLDLYERVPRRIRGQADWYRLISGRSEAGEIQDTWPLREVAADFAGTPLEALDLQLRTRNCLRNAGFKTVGDLRPVSEGQLRSLRGLGEVSYQDVVTSVQVLATRAPGANLLGPGMSDLDCNQTAVSIGDARADGANANSTLPPGVAPARLVHAVEEEMARLSDRQEEVLRWRLGWDGPPRTLQEVADEYGLTRERVRQIEVKAVDSIRSMVGVSELELEGAISRALEDREIPLYLEGIESELPFLGGLSQRGNLLVELLRRLAGSRYHVLEFPEGKVLARISEEEWSELLRQTRHALRSMARDLTDTESARAIVSAIARQSSASELAGKIWAEMLLEIGDGFGCNGGTWSNLKSIVGSEHFIAEVLRRSRRQMHHTEVRDALESEYGIALSPGHLQRVLRSSEALLVARGTWLWHEYYRFDEEQVGQIRNSLEEESTYLDGSRQWHSLELLELLVESYSKEDLGVDPKSLTPYDLVIILRESTAFKYLGRMVWAVFQENGGEALDRVSVYEAAKAIIERAGKPLRGREIAKEISLVRGYGTAVQLRPDADLVRLTPGLWGLRRRDVPLPLARESVFLLRLQSVLEERGRGLHVAEIVAALGDAWPEELDSHGAQLAVGLAERDQRFIVASGAFIGLSKWGGVRRASSRAAVRTVLADYGTGVAREDLRTRAERVSGGPVSDEALSDALRRAEAVFDSETGLWYPAEDEQPDS